MYVKVCVYLHYVYAYVYVHIHIYVCVHANTTLIHVNIVIHNEETPDTYIA